MCNTAYSTPQTFIFRISTKHFILGFISSLCNYTTKGECINKAVCYKVFKVHRLKVIFKLIKVLTRQWSSVSGWLERIIWWRSVSINSETRYTSLKFSFCGGRIISLMDIICIGNIIDKQLASWMLLKIIESKLNEENPTKHLSWIKDKYS